MSGRGKQTCLSDWRPWGKRKKRKKRGKEKLRR